MKVGVSNAAVLTTTRQLEIWDTRRPQSPRTFRTQGSRPPVNLDVQGNIAIYTTGQSVHAIDLSTGKDRVVGRLQHGDVAVAHIDSAGLAYAGHKTLVFLPIEQVASAVR